MVNEENEKKGRTEANKWRQQQIEIPSILIELYGKVTHKDIDDMFGLFSEARIPFL